jgi:hypothetical protein
VKGFFAVPRSQNRTDATRGTSRAEALDAGLKIAVSGAFVIGGVLLEEYLSKTLGTLLPFCPVG